MDGKIYLLAKATDCEIPLLSELIAINDIPINEYLDKYIFPYCWHEIKSHAIYQMQMILPLVEYKKEVKFTTSNGEFILKATNQEQTWENAWYNMYLKEKEKHFLLLIMAHYILVKHMMILQLLLFQHLQMNV